MAGTHKSHFKDTATVGWCLLAFPFPVYYALLLYAAVAWYQVGHFPYYGHPDPKDVGLGLLYVPVFLFCMIGALFAWLANLAALPLMLVAATQRRTSMRHLSLALAISGFHCFFISSDPLGLWEWLAD
jgi:hypothetical protein